MPRTKLSRSYRSGLAELLASPPARKSAPASPYKRPPRMSTAREEPPIKIEAPIKMEAPVKMEPQPELELEPPIGGMSPIFSEAFS